MDTFRKWLNKPKADDKSLLARFYHADRSLTAVASELDSFDGRAEPDRCSRLVNRLRQNQDKVLAITNLIMEELLGEDRDPRSFRAKFPEEVLQENLAGQLWFGAECLAAGSSIINREQESKEMRPLAQAVTKSLGNVRNLLRDQCLRNNVPNSRTLHLDLNDSTTEQLCESLKIFDRLFAEFELRYVSAMVQVKTKHEYEMQQMICVLFSETLQRALKTGLLDQDKVDAFDPALMFSIPRLAIIAGLVIYHRGPLNMDMPADQLSEMFRPFRTILIKIRDLLRTLNRNELYQLERLLCTNEDIHLKVQVGSSSIEAPNSDQQNNNSNSNNCDETTGGGDDNNESTARPTTTARRHDNNNSSSAEPSTSPKKVLKSVNGGIPPGGGEMGSRRAAFTMRHLSRTSVSSVSVNSSAASTPSVSPSASPTPSHSIASTSSAVSMSTTSPADWTDDDDDEEDDSADELENTNVLPTESDIVANDCASGFLIPNTNFGNLLQPQEVPLTDNFIASEDEFASNQNEGDVEDEDEDDYDDHDHDHDDGDSNDLPTTSTALLLSPANGGDGHHQMHHNRHSDSSEDSEQLTIKASTKSLESCDTISNGPYGKVVEKSCASGVSKSSDSGSCSSNSSSCRLHRHHHHRSQDHTNNKAVNEVSSGSSGSSAVVRRHHHHHHHTHPHPHRHHHHHHHHHRHHHSKSKRSSLEGGEEGSGGEHKDTSSAAATTTTTITTTTTTSWSSKLTKSMQHDTSSPDSSTSSSPSDGDPHEVSLALRAAGRLKFKSTENLLHRLFVCIAGVADQLQTNFAYDLRQILRSVFLMNMSLAQDDIIDIPEKTKDSELFEFRASENDVIQESAGSNQSIYSAEEVNPELDNVFNNSGSSSGGGRRSTGSSGSNSVGGIQRVNTIDLGTTGGGDATMAASHNRSHIGRTRSLGDQEGNVLTTSSTTSTTSNNRQLSSYISGRRLSSPHRQQSTTSTTSHHQSSHRHRNRNNSVGSNSPTNSSTSSSSSAASSSSESNSPVSERVSGGGGYSMSPRQQQQQQHLNAGANNQSPITAISNNINNNNMPDAASSAPPASQSQAQSPPNARLAPPAWIPDDKAPRCMSCHTPFTAFRRRHHCRNCGGVFCGVCSNSSAPLPKYGLTKAVRVCRECYVREVRGRAASVHNGSVSTGRSNASPRALSSSAASAAAATAGGS